MHLVAVLSLWIIFAGYNLFPAWAVQENNFTTQWQPTYYHINSDDNSSLECNTTPLHLAVGLVHILIEQGDDLQAVDCLGKTPVDIAVDGSIHELFPRILEHLKTYQKSNFTSSNCSSTPLHDALHSLSSLVERGSNLHVQNCQGLTPVDVARATENVVVLSLHEKNIDDSIEPPVECNRTLLHLAVISNDTWKVHQLLLNKADIYETDCQGMTPMDLAVVENNHEMIIALAQQQYDVNRKHKDHSLLYHAVTKGTLPIVKLLLDLGANNNIKEDLLIQAIQSRQTDIAELLIANGAKLSKLSEDGETYVHNFTKEGNVRGLLELKKLNLLTALLADSPNKKGETPLFLAVKKNYPAIVNILLSSGANSKKTLKDGKSYLHIAVEYKNKDAVLALLENESPVDTKDDNDVSPILIAIQNDDTKIMDILNDFGSDLKQRSQNESTLLHAAAISGSLQAVQWLMDKDASIDEKNDEDFTALHQAARFGKDSVVKELLSRKANANAETKYKDTPLHWAAFNGNLQVVKHLILNGANVNSKQHRLWTPLHLAAYHGHLPIVKELLLNGAEINALNEPGHSPLFYAIDRSHHDTKNYLISMGGIKK